MEVIDEGREEGLIAKKGFTAIMGLIELKQANFLF